jgi:hypothetical protein
MKQFDIVVNNYLGSLKENTSILSQMLKTSQPQDAENIISALAALAANKGNVRGLDPKAQQTLSKFDLNFDKISSTLSPASSGTPTSTTPTSTTPTTTQPASKGVTVSPQTPTSTTINPQYPS